MNDEQLIEVVAIAKAAGRAIMEIYARADHGVATKDDASPLTLADLAAHGVICNRLRVLTPSIPVVSEEDHDQGARQEKCAGTFWLVDPLDGTKEFVARNGEFTVNIALIVGGQPVWGVVESPALTRTYWGGADYGAILQEAESSRSIRVSGPVTEGVPLRVVASKSHLNEQTKGFIERLGNVEIVQAGSSLKFCRIAEGSADIYPRLGPTCEWDTAAAQAVVEGAGGVVLDLQGMRLAYGKADVRNPAFVAASHIPPGALGTA